MAKYKRISEKFVWVPPEKRPGKIPGPKPYRPPNHKIPLYFLMPEGDELFFVNNSEEELIEVHRKTNDYLSMDGDGAPVPLSETTVRYEKVKPKEAVKIEHYDKFFDSGCFIAIELFVMVDSSEKIKFRIMNKGCIEREVVLLWDNGDVGKNVSATKQ